MTVSDFEIAEPERADFVTRAFAVGMIRNTAPTSIAERLAGLEVTRRDGTIPLVITSDEIVSMYLADFLGMPGTGGAGEVEGCRSTR